MISFFQGFIKLTHSCTFRCLGCPLAAHEDPTLLDGLAFHIKNHSFFKIYPKKLNYHILGGDPLLCPELPSLLTFFNQESIHHTLWTHGQIPLSKWHPLLPLLDRVSFFFPSTDPKIFREITGLESLEDSLSTIRYLVAKDIKVWINHPITSNTIDELPEMHALARSLDCQLLLHYDPKDFSNTEKAYIHRYDWISKVMVLKNTLVNTNTSFCQAIPLHGLQNPLEISRQSFISLLSWLKSYLRI